MIALRHRLIEALNAAHARTGWRGYFSSSRVHMTKVEARAGT
jgi:hypothetical protein